MPYRALRRGGWWASDWNARSGAKIIDLALYNDVQPHYTAAPIFVGLKDPFPVRSGLTKKIVDAQHREVITWRYECAKCGCTFRVYPQGVSNKQISKRVLGMAIMLYVLGLSYGAVEIVLSSLGVGIGKTSIYTPYHQRQVARRAVFETAGLVLGVGVGVWLAVLLLAGLGRSLMGSMMSLPIDTAKIRWNRPLAGDGCTIAARRAARSLEARPRGLFRA